MDRVSTIAHKQTVVEASRFNRRSQIAGRRRFGERGDEAGEVDVFQKPSAAISSSI